MADNSTEKEYMVYCHESPHGKRYVGITCVGEKKRWGINGYGYRNNKHFWAAIQKWGWNNFEHYILFEGLTQEQAESKEKELISLWNTTSSQNGYNHDTGGNAGKHLSSETKKKLSVAMQKYFETHIPYRTGIPMSDEAKKKLSQSRKGTKWTEETRNKILQTRKANNYHHSLETREKIRQSNINSEKREKLCKSVCQYDIEGNYVQKYKSIREAVRETGVNRQQLSACCNGKGSIANGYIWRFSDNNNVPLKIDVSGMRKNAINTNNRYLQYSIDGKLLQKYDSNEQLKNAGFVPSDVRRCCNHIRNTYKGCIWEYDEGGEIDEQEFKRADN